MRLHVSVIQQKLTTVSLLAQDTQSFRCPKKISISDLETNADVVLYAYGTGDGGQKQETPNYTLKLAEQYPEKTIELIHCDTAMFRGHLVSWIKNQSSIQAPWCIRSKDWELVNTPDDQKDCLQFRHNQFKNLTCKLLNKDFPVIDYRFYDKIFHDQFQGMIADKLHQGKQIFFGIHNQCWNDDSIMASVYNEMVKDYNSKIHLYIQAANVDAFVYSGIYHKIVGKFAQHLHWHLGWLENCQFKHVLSQPNPSSSEIAKVRTVMETFLKDGRYSNEDQKSLLSILNNHSVQIIPIEQLSFIKTNPFSFVRDTSLGKQSFFAKLIARVNKTFQMFCSTMSFLTSQVRRIVIK